MVFLKKDRIFYRLQLSIDRPMINYWNNLIEESNEALSGYDDFLVNDEGNTNWGSFEVTGWNWDFGDKPIDLGGNVNNDSYFTTQASRVL